MQRKKTMLIAALTVSAALAGFVVAGSALGATWHEYDGRLTAGQAYLVPVPAGAETLSFAIVPTGEAPSAKLVVFDPEDERLGFVALDGATDAHDVVDPLSGDYVVYVYELKQATLAVRLQAGEAGEALSVVKTQTVRSDKPIVRDHEGGAIQKDVTARVKGEPVFATILYQGTVENLNAVLESESGVVLTVTGESGTSYAPGLNVGQAASREATLENLASGTYTASVSADALDGTLYLTTLTYKRIAPHATPVAPEPPEVAEPDPAIVEPQGARLPAGVPVAVEVDRAELMLALPSYFCAAAPAADEDEDAGEESTESPCEERHAGRGWTPMGPRHRWHEHATVSVYDPLDALVGVYRLDSEDASVTLKNLTAGEYVLFAHGHTAPDEDELEDAMEEPVAFLVDPADPALPLVSRPIALVESSFALERADAIAYEESATLAFATAPLGIMAYVDEETYASGWEATLESPEGTVFRMQNLVTAGHFTMWWMGGHYDAEALVPGEYAFDVSALAYHGSTGLVWTTYDRSFAFGEGPALDEVEEDEDEEDAEDGSEPAAPAASLGGVLARLGL